MLPHILFSTILHKSKAAFAGTAHPHFKQMSKIALRILPASPLDCRQMRKTDQKKNLQNISVEAGRMTMEAITYLLRQTVFGILKTLVV